MKELILGTAQLGLDYGITNGKGKPSYEIAKEIVRQAYLNGVRYFDTAQAYGNSENLLGQILRELCISEKVSVNTKIDASLTLSEKGALTQSVLESQENLGQKKIWSIMLHDFEMFVDLQNNFEEIRVLKKEKIITHFGVSVYSTEEALEALSCRDIDIIQVPSNAWDFRMCDKGIFQKAKDLNKRVMVRSVYLQGLLLLSEKDMLTKMKDAFDLSLAWNEWLRSNGVNPIEASLGIVSSYADDIIVGIDSPEQIIETADFFKSIKITKQMTREWRGILETYKTDKIIDPRSWK